MQTAIQVTCKQGESLRTRIANNYSKLEKYNLAVVAEKSTRRNPGWMKIRGTEPGVWGALNVSWDTSTATLTGRVVNRRLGTPEEILGRFVAYLLRYHKKRIRMINIFQI